MIPFEVGLDGRKIDAVVIPRNSSRKSKKQPKISTKMSKSESRMLSLILVPIPLIARKRSMMAFT